MAVFFSVTKMAFLPCSTPYSLGMLDLTMILPHAVRKFKQDVKRHMWEKFTISQPLGELLAKLQVKLSLADSAT